MFYFQIFEESGFLIGNLRNDCDPRIIAAISGASIECGLFGRIPLLRFVGHFQRIFPLYLNHESLDGLENRFITTIKGIRIKR
jgi:hypothetical protein